jgi:hypothetical protein
LVLLPAGAAASNAAATTAQLHLVLQCYCAGPAVTSDLLDLNFMAGCIWTGKNPIQLSCCFAMCCNTCIDCCLQETRRAYRELFYTALIGEAGISGAIMFKETLQQAAADGTPFVQCLTQQGVMPGIKVDEVRSTQQQQQQQQQ